MTTAVSWREAPEGDFGVIGFPVNHSLSPRMHQAAYDALGLPYSYSAVEVPPGEVVEALDRLRSIGYRGINVTVPHKEEALSWSEQEEPFAARVRAANTLRLGDRSCINTDAPGFLDTLLDLPVSSKSVLVLGAGGSARAVVTALAQEGWEIRIYNRTQSKALELADSVGAAAVESPDPAGSSVILNTTSASLGGEEIPIAWDRASTGAVAYDLMYSRESTP
ncbi:MAG TPA: shikimate dehydrogenase, partial [Fimbriimonas sp.]|nr:shikimate dehydrogenase [Fimbriimonas sp.]